MAGLDVLRQHQHADGGMAALDFESGLEPLVVWVGGILMSMMATSGR